MNINLHHIFVIILMLAASLAMASDKVEAVVEGNELILRNQHVQLSINKANFTLQQITERVAKTSYVKEPGGDLLRIKMGNDPQVVSELSGKSFSRYSYKKIISTKAPGWELHFHDAPVQGGGTLSAVVTVTLDPTTSLFTWGLSIENKSSTALMETQFPYLSGLASDRAGSEKTDYLAVPAYSGVKYVSPRTHGIAGPGYTEVPSSGMSVQLLSYCDGQGGTLYFAAHDPKYYHKAFTCWSSPSKDSFFMSVTHYAEKSAKNTTWTLPYPVVCGPIQGDWYDAAKRYRAWTSTLPQMKSLAVRKDIPSWFKNLSVWIIGATWSDSEAKFDEFADDLVDLRQKLGEPIGIHWYIWQKYNQHDYRYPDYLPARPGFKEAVQKVQKAGVYVMPYINIQLCDTTLPIWTEEKASESARLNPAGKPYMEYGAGGAASPMAPMCVCNDYWQKKMLGIAKQVVTDYNVDAIYWDQVNFYPAICYATNHKHLWQGGTYDHDGVANILDQTLKMKKDMVTTGEGLQEVYIGKCTGQLNAHADMKPDSLPIFQSVHAGRTTEIGVYVHSGNDTNIDTFNSKLAFNLVRGRQLGWFNTDYFHLNRPEMAQQLGLVKSYSAARKANLGFLCSGEMLRTPDLSMLPKIKRRWVIWPGPDTIDYDLPVVLAECYRSAKCEIGIVLANHTDTDQTISIPWNQKDWGIKTGADVTRTDWVNGIWSAAVTSKLTSRLSITVPARSPAVIKIAVGKGTK